MLCSAWQCIMAFENAKGLNEKKVFFLLFTWLFTMQTKPREGLGQGSWCLTSSCSAVSGSHLQSCHRGAGPSLGHEYKDSHTKQQRTESPSLGHSMILRHKSRNQREKMERVGRIPISIPKGRCHKASKLPNLTDLFLSLVFREVLLFNTMARWQPNT